MRRIFLLTMCLLAAGVAFSQKKKEYKVACVGFYNLENLFDTLDGPNDDKEFLPDGVRRWTGKIYWDKQKNLARVISEIGTEDSPDGLAFLGVAEVENRSVLEDLVKQPAIANRHYQVIHYDSPDERGIDVGFLYQPKYFTVTGSKSIPLLIYDDKGERNLTRDILYVGGMLDNDPVHILVNHWPSRRGGETATRPYRNAAALQCKNLRDSLLKIDPNVKVFVMGDLNDDPNSPSIKDVLACKNKLKDVRKNDFFNPFYDFFKQGYGTMAYQDAWSLFDQVILSAGLVGERKAGYRFHSAHLFNKPYLIQKTGQYKGYPFRTFDFDNYIAGYSDHFATYVMLVKATAEGAKP